MQVLSHIIIRNGTAYIDGQGFLKAEMVARMVVDGDYSVEATMQHYNLSAAEVHAALVYYYDNRHELDERLAKQLAEIDANSLKASEHLALMASRVNQKPEDC
jgi:uncharacterized protein (DUF433 family)